MESFKGFQKHLKCKEREFKTNMTYMGPNASMTAGSREYLSENTHLKRELSYREASEIHSSHKILL